MRAGHGLAVSLGVAALVTLTPGPATALAIRSALRGGRRSAFLSTLGNSLGVLAWGVASALGVSALIAASEVARRAFVSGPWQRRFERVAGSVMIGFGLRLATEAR